MKEQFEALVGLILSALRFRWTAIIVGWVVALIGVAAVLAIPNKYRSHAQIYVDTRSVLRPLLQGIAVSPQDQEQTDVVRRALLARPSLDEVSRKVGLYKRTTTAEGQESLLTSLATQITIGGDPAAGIYSISYEDASAKTAEAVVQTLLETFVQRSLGAGRSDTQDAERFLRQQVADYERTLSESERRLAEFKKKNVGLMPDQRGDYFGRLQTELTAQEKIGTDLAVAMRQRDELRRKISGQENGEALLKSTPSSSDIQAATVMDARIRDSRRQLDELLLKFTDKHPQVLALQDTIRRLEQQRREQLGGVVATNGTRSEGSSMPVDPVVQSLQIALNTADVQVATLQTQASQSADRVAELRRVVTTGPEVEAELARLNRDYGVTKTQYEELLKRLGTARLSNDADRSEDRRFKILESPRAALRPVSPNRMLLLVGVLFGALIIGFAAALLRALTQPVFFSKRALANFTGLPVIGVVSRARSPSAIAAGRREAFACVVATVLLVGSVVAAGVLNYPAAEFVRHAMGLEVT